MTHSGSFDQPHPDDAGQMALPLSLRLRNRRAEPTRELSSQDVLAGLVEAVSMIARMEGAAGLGGKRGVLPWLGRARARLVAAHPHDPMPPCITTPALDRLLLEDPSDLASGLEAGLGLLQTRVEQLAITTDDLAQLLHLQEALALLDRGRRSLTRVDQPRSEQRSEVGSGGACSLRLAPEVFHRT